MTIFSMPLRILYSHRIVSRDGQGVHLDALVEALRAEGHEGMVVGADRSIQGTSRPSW